MYHENKQVVIVGRFQFHKMDQAVETLNVLQHVQQHYAKSQSTVHVAVTWKNPLEIVWVCLLMKLYKGDYWLKVM